MMVMGEKEDGGSGRGTKGAGRCQRDRACGAASASLDTGEAQKPATHAPRFLPCSRSPDVCARSPIHLPCFEEPCHVREELPPPPGINPKDINTHTVSTLDRTLVNSGIKKNCGFGGMGVDDRRLWLYRACRVLCLRARKTTRRPSASGRSRTLARPAALTWSAHARTRRAHRRSTNQHPIQSH